MFLVCISLSCLIAVAGWACSVMQGRNVFLSGGIIIMLCSSAVVVVFCCLFLTVFFLVSLSKFMYYYDYYYYLQRPQQHEKIFMTHFHSFSTPKNNNGNNIH